MSAEDNKARMRRIPEELFNKGELSVADEVMAADYVEHVPRWPTGSAGLKQFVTMMRAAFPDFHYTTEDELADGDKVAMTQRGQLRATGAPLVP